MWHFIATLIWPGIFNPTIWLVSISIFVIIFVTIQLMERSYLLAQVIWQGGLSFVIILAYYLV